MVIYFFNNHTRVTALMLAAMMLFVSMPAYAATGRQEGVTIDGKYYTMTWNVTTTSLNNTVVCTNAMGVAAIMDAYYTQQGALRQQLEITVRSEPGNHAFCAWSVPGGGTMRYGNFYAEVDYRRVYFLQNMYP